MFGTFKIETPGAKIVYTFDTPSTNHLFTLSSKLSLTTDSSSQQLYESLESSSVSPSVSASSSCSSFSVSEWTPSETDHHAPPPGSFARDSVSGKYPLKWESLNSFYGWKQKEEAKHAIEFRRIKERAPAKSRQYCRQIYYVCSRHGTGGASKYQKKHPDWKRRVENKRTNCPSTIYIKTYPDVETVLGRYKDEHNHDLGDKNLKYTRITKETREYIAGLLRSKVDPTHILKLLHHGRYNDDYANENEDSLPPSRNEFIQLRDIRRIEKAIEAESIQLDPKDDVSVMRWVDRLRERKSLLGFKAKSQLPPEGSKLEVGTFFLAIQTPWQRKIFAKYGPSLVCIDGTHNVTVYENLILTSLIVRNRRGHGIPIAWMLASSGTAETISFFLILVKRREPSVLPRIIMSDRDLAQINACRSVFPNSQILLCWWHVLHAWQQHFHISGNEQLWDLLKGWIRLSDNSTFSDTWEKIKSIAPEDFLAYIQEYWLPDEFKRMWSNQFRLDRTIWEESDTNMLIEAWHHVLKGKFLQGKRNRRMDHLIACLADEVQPYYKLKEHREEYGFEGDDLEVERRKEIAEQCDRQFKMDDIEVVESEGECSDSEEDSAGTTQSMYLVQSKSCTSRRYQVDLDTYTCTCVSFPAIRYCKHICAVQKFYPTDRPASTDSLASVTTSPEDGLSPDLIHGSPLGSTSLVLPTTPSVATSDVSSTISRVRLTETLELLTGRLRSMSGELDETWWSILADAAFSAAQHSSGHSVLPSRLRVPPNVNTWNETKAVMPPMKTKRKRAGDPAYGAGEASGKKAKLSKRQAKQSTSAPTVSPAHQKINETLTAAVRVTTTTTALPPAQSSAPPPPPPAPVQPLPPVQRPPQPYHMPASYYPYYYYYPGPAAASRQPLQPIQWNIPNQQYPIPR